MSAGSPYQPEKGTPPPSSPSSTRLSSVDALATSSLYEREMSGGRRGGRGGGGEGGGGSESLVDGRISDRPRSPIALLERGVLYPMTELPMPRNHLDVGRRMKDLQR